MEDQINAQILVRFTFVYLSMFPQAHRTCDQLVPELFSLFFKKNVHIREPLHVTENIPGYLAYIYKKANLKLNIIKSQQYNELNNILSEDFLGCFSVERIFLSLNTGTATVIMFLGLIKILCRAWTQGRQGSGLCFSKWRHNLHLFKRQVVWFQIRLLQGRGVASGWSREKSYPYVPLFSHNEAHYFGNQGMELPLVVILKGRSTFKAAEPDFYHMQSLQRLYEDVLFLMLHRSSHLYFLTKF